MTCLFEYMLNCSRLQLFTSGSGGIIIFEVKEGQDNYEILELLPVLLLGVVGGLLGSGFVALTALVGHWRKTIFWPQWGATGKVVEALLVSLMTSIVSFGLPMMLSCQVRLTKCFLEVDTTLLIDSSV